MDGFCTATCVQRCDDHTIWCETSHPSSRRSSGGMGGRAVRQEMSAERRDASPD